jgi:hypothetical protein
LVSFVDLFIMNNPNEEIPLESLPSYVCQRRGAVPDQITEGEEFVPVASLTTADIQPADGDPMATSFDVSEPKVEEVDKTADYLSNSDSVWLKKDGGEFITFADKTYQKAEDQWDEEEGIEYFQVVRDSLEPEDLDRAIKTAKPFDVANVKKVFIIGIKNDELTTEIKIGGRPFYVEGSNSGDDDNWNVQFVSVD